MLNEKIKICNVTERCYSQIGNIGDLNLLFEVTESMIEDVDSSVFLSQVLDFSKNISIGGVSFNFIYKEFNENTFKIVVGELKSTKEFIFYIFGKDEKLVTDVNGVGADYLFNYVYNSLSNKIKEGKTICNEDYSMAISQIIEVGDELIVGSNVYKLMEDEEYGEFYMIEKGVDVYLDKEQLILSDLLEVMDNIVSKHSNKVILLKKDNGWC